MPFLLPFAPALIGAAGAIGGSLIGRKAGAGSANQKQAYNLLNYNAQLAPRQAQQLFGQGQQLTGKGMNLLDRAQGAAGGAQSYFQQLLSGSPAATTSALAPDISRIRDTSQQALQSTSTLAPRGGGRSGTLFNLPFQQQAQTSGLYNMVRPMAARGLLDVGGLFGNLGLGTAGVGLGAAGVGTNLLNAGNYAAGTMFGGANNLAMQGAQAGAAGGQGIFDILRSLPWDKILKGGAGGGGGGGGLIGDFKKYGSD